MTIFFHASGAGLSLASKFALALSGLRQATDHGVLLIGSVIIMVIGIVLAGAAYTEYKAAGDFIGITTNGFEYHFSPIFPFGWLPKHGEVSFSDVKAIRVTQIRRDHQPSRKFDDAVEGDLRPILARKLTLIVELKPGRTLYLCRRLPAMKVLQSAALIEGGAVIGPVFASITEKFPGVTSNIKKVLSIVREVLQRKD
ncbi:MAG TPA: hypothetical protein VJ044_13695 [Candidatus Hodarchaeales archaeon]|nr:hypothetical protein [Candidatus Hodarchaeales archaeon]